MALALRRFCGGHPQRANISDYAMHRSRSHDAVIRRRAETNGDNERARALYIRLRVAQLEQNASRN